MAMKRVRRYKKREENDGNDPTDPTDPLSVIPLELKAEILMKLPPKSIGRLGFVTRQWSSMIRGKEFTDLYLNRSLTQPRLLFSVYRPGMQIQFFHSCSQEDPSSSSSDHHHHKVSYNSDLKYKFNPPIRGLIFGRNGTKAMIGNPSTGQMVTLPRIKTRKKDILSVFGYDPVNDQYKVLCMTKPIQRRSPFDDMWEEYQVAMSEEHQVFTLGPKQKWRMITCKYPHGHYSGSQGICRDGVLYYLASYNKKRSLINFDLRSEEFSVTKLPDDYHLQQFGKLVNHSGKITIVAQAYYGPFDIWVMEDGSKEEWSKTANVVPSWANIVGNDQRVVMFRGMLRTGEIILAPTPPPNPFFFLCYDINEKIARKVVIEGIGDDSADIQVFFDHLESPMFLSKVK